MENSEQVEKKTPRQKKSSRELRRKAREGQRSRNLGVGLVIPSETKASSNKHVVFDDEENEESNNADRLDREEEESIDNTPSQDASETEPSDDDDVVEEVKSNVARKQAMHQREMERETVKLLHKSKKRKRTSGKGETSVDSGGDEFDDDFFAKVDSEMANKRQELRESQKDHQQPKGRHTTFVSSNEDATNALSIEAEHNIELVVLGSDNAENSTSPGGHEERLRAMDARMGSAQPSKVALAFSRSGLVAGDEHSSKKSAGKSKAKTKDEQGWKRSRKMNRMALSRLRFHRRAGRGVPATHFVKKG